MINIYSLYVASCNRAPKLGLPWILQFRILCLEKRLNFLPCILNQITHFKTKEAKMRKSKHTSTFLLAMYLLICQITIAESHYANHDSKGFLSISKRGTLVPNDYCTMEKWSPRRQSSSINKPAMKVFCHLFLLTLSNILGVRSPVTGWIQCNSCQWSGGSRHLTHRLTTACFRHTFPGAKSYSGTRSGAEVRAGVWQTWNIINLCWCHHEPNWSHLGGGFWRMHFSFSFPL